MNDDEKVSVMRCIELGLAVLVLAVIAYAWIGSIAHGFLSRVF